MMIHNIPIHLASIYTFPSTGPAKTLAVFEQRAQALAEIGDQLPVITHPLVISVTVLLTFCGIHSISEFISLSSLMYRRPINWIPSPHPPPPYPQTLMPPVSLMLPVPPTPPTTLTAPTLSTRVSTPRPWFFPSLAGLGTRWPRGTHLGASCACGW